MADIQELCQRVIIIDKGTIFFDGFLAEILDRFADFRRSSTISWEIGASFPSLDFARYGQLIEQSPNRIQLKVKRDSVIAVCKELLDKVPVNDIDIQEVPIEEVIRQIFCPIGLRSCRPHRCFNDSRNPWRGYVFREFQRRRIQARTVNPAGRGPSSKRCPVWLSQRAQRISVRCIPYELSSFA